VQFESINRIIFREKETISAVLKRFNETAVMTEQKGFGLVTNQLGELTGVVSEGDIRRKLLEGVSIKSPIIHAMNRRYAYVTQKHTTHQILRLFDVQIVNLPLVDEQHRPVDLYRCTQFKASAYAQPRIIRARVPVRVSFSGGGTDVSHYINQNHASLLSSTINKYCTASVLPRSDNNIEIVSNDLKKSYQVSNLEEISYDGQLDLLKAAVRMMQPEFGFTLETFSEFEVGTGLGGSSAMTVAVIGALNSFRKESQLDLYQIADLAYQSERIELGIEGGWQDQYATTFGGFNWVEFQRDEIIVHPLRLQKDIILELEFNMMLFRIGGQRDSGSIQEGLIQELTNSKVSQATWEAMSDLAVEMKENLLRGKLKKFGDLLHNAWQMKKKMNRKVSSPLVEQCYQTAREIGALGGKLLGAGKEGYLLLYASPLHQRSIQAALEEQGCRLETLRFTENGLEVWSTSR
jgi:D-glycero-alpha-D-manno-heptose-7-phosphate kinase